MGAYSTLNITRSSAIKQILSYVATADTETLEHMMDAVLEDRLYNCRIVPDDWNENDDEVLY